MATKKIAKKPVKKAPAKKPVAKKAVKPVAKKAAPAKKAAKPAAKKAAKPVAKKPVKEAKPAVKKPVKKVETKKAPVKKVEPKKAVVKKPEPKKAVIKPQVEKKPDAGKKRVKPPTAAELEAAAAAAEAKKHQNFAFMIAQQMKKQAQAELAREAEKEEIKLSRRPTTRSAGKQTNQFPAADLKAFRKMLMDLRDAVLGQSGALKSAALEQNDERVAEDDDGTDAYMRLQALGQVGNQNQTILKIDEALHKIDDGSYGVCEVCGQLIRKPRLQHLPFARTCMECQSAMEKPYGNR